MGEINVDLSEFDDHNEEDNVKLKEITAGLPSASAARLEQFKTDVRVQLNYTCVPKIIKDLAEKKANELGMNKKEFLYYALRKVGVEIPAYSELDARIRVKKK